MKKSSERTLDELLVIQSQLNDRKAVSLLIKRWHPKLLGYVYRITNNREASRDIVQESWHAIVTSLQGLNDPARFSVWAYRISRAKAVDWIRNQQKRRKLDLASQEISRLDAIPTTNDIEDKVKVIRLAMHSLSSEKREILSLFYLDNHSLRDIGEILSIPEGTVKSRLYHAREHLKKLLESKKRNDEK